MEYRFQGEPVIECVYNVRNVDESSWVCRKFKRYKKGKIGL